MSDKYIIKNCPCYIDMPLHNHDKVCRLGDIVKPNHKELYVYCQDCTDCILKQIVELCKEQSNRCKRCKTFEDYQPTDCLHCSNDDVVFANDILKLLDIEEVE